MVCDSLGCHSLGCHSLGCNSLGCHVLGRCSQGIRWCVIRWCVVLPVPDGWCVIRCHVRLTLWTSHDEWALIQKKQHEIDNIYEVFSGNGHADKFQLVKLPRGAPLTPPPAHPRILRLRLRLVWRFFL